MKSTVVIRNIHISSVESSSLRRFHGICKFWQGNFAILKHACHFLEIFRVCSDRPGHNNTIRVKPGNYEDAFWRGLEIASAGEVGGLL